MLITRLYAVHGHQQSGYFLNSSVSLNLYSSHTAIDLVLVLPPCRLMRFENGTADDVNISDAVISSIAIVAGVITAIANIGTERDDLCWVQDDVTELDFHTKKALTNSDILELGERMIDGQTKGDALNEMGLLAKEKKRKGKRRE